MKEENLKIEAAGRRARQDEEEYRGAGKNMITRLNTKSIHISDSHLEQH